MEGIQNGYHCLDEDLVVELLLGELPHVVPQKERVLRPPHLPGRSPHHPYGLRHQVLLGIGLHAEDHLSRKGEEEGEDGGEGEGTGRARLSKPAEGSGPPVQLDVAHVLKEVHFGVLAGERGGHVRKLGVGGVGPDQL